MRRSTTLRLGIIYILLAVLLVIQAAVAQHEEPNCSLEELIEHQNEHAQELANFREVAEIDLDAALATLYRTAIAYQALAIECGFTNGPEVEAAHEAEHAGDETHEHSEDEAIDQLELARSIGDPEQGEILFNTFRPEVSFACATCHRVDTTEQLVGPGLLGIGNPAHDPSAHNTEASLTETEEAGGHEAHHETSPEEATMEATAAVERTVKETIEYLHTSIIDPSAYVVPGFPDDLMPKTYSGIFTEAEIDNLVAYLLTL